MKKVKRNSWDLNKILTELQIPKEQKQIIIDSNFGGFYIDEISLRENIIMTLLADNSFVVEINTSTIKTDNQNLTEDDQKDLIKESFDNDELTIEEYNEAIFNINGIYDPSVNIPTQHYYNLTVPGGTNYTENEISTPAITPNIKGHAQFSTDNGIGWFRSDEQTEKYTQEKEEYIQYDTEDEINTIEIKKEKYKGGIPTKTRRILEVQSDLFQKGRDKKILTSFEKEVGLKTVDFDDEGRPLPSPIYEKIPNSNEKNQFLQLLNKSNNWVTFFVKSIIQDSAKKGYEKVLFPSGDTAAKIEGHQTLEEFKKQKEARIKELEAKLKDENKLLNNYNQGVKILEKQIEGFNKFIKDGKNIEKNAEYLKKSKSDLQNHLNSKELKRKEAENNINTEIKTLKQELADVEAGKTQLSSIAKFYETTIANVLQKNGYSPIEITDEYGNKWNEIDLENTNTSVDLSPLKESSKLQELKDKLYDKRLENFTVQEYQDVVDYVSSQLIIQNYTNLYETGNKIKFKDAADNIKVFYEPERNEYFLIDDMLNNWDSIVKDAIDNLQVLGKVKNNNDENADEYEDSEFSFEKVGFSDNAIWATDSKFNASSLLKEFLFLTYDRAIVKDKVKGIQFETIEDSLNLGNKLVPIDIVFNTLKEVLADNEPSFEILEAKMKELRMSYPWIQDILDKFNGSGDYSLFSKALDLNQIKQQFTVIMTNSSYDFRTFLNQSGDNPSSSVIKTNRYSTQSMLINKWIENFRFSPIVNNIDGEFIIDNDKRENLISKYETRIANKDFKPTEKDIIEFLKPFGITLSDKFINKLINQKVDKLFPIQQWKNKAGIFNLMYQRLKGLDNDQSESDFAKFNPLYDNSGITRLANGQSDFNDLAQSSSFLDGRGNMVNSVNQQRDIVIRFNDLFEEGKAEKLLKVPFLNNNDQNTWLKRIANKELTFKDKFRISFIDTHKEKGVDFKGKKPTEFSKRRIDSTKLIGFNIQDKNYAEYVWYVPGKSAISIKAPTEEVKLNDNLELSDINLNQLYSIVKSEINRINASENVVHQGYNPNQFYIFPQLNDLALLSNPDMKILDNINDENVETTIKDFLQKEFKKVNEDKIKILTKEGLIKDGKFTGIDTSKSIEQFIAEYNFNYMLFHHNMFQSFIGDPALFSKSKNGKVSILDSWDNFSKRGVKDMTSGVRIPYYKNNKNYIQLALKTTKRSSKNIDQIRERFDETSDYVRNFSNIDISDAAEYITYKERLDNYEALGIITEEDHDRILKILDSGKELTDNDLEGVKSGLFGPAKPVQTGKRIVKDNEGSPLLESIDYVKSAEIVLMPQFTKGFPELDKLRSKMENLQSKTGINVRASYDSANKLGGGIPLENLDLEVNESNYIVSDRKGLRYQTEIPYDADKTKIVDGTQPRKNIELLLDNETKNKYRSLYNEIYKSNKDQFDIKYTKDGRLDEQVIYKELIKEAKGRGWSDREIKSIEFKNGRFLMPLMLNSSDRIQSLITSFANNKILKNKRFGKSYTAMSEEGFEGYSSDMVYSESYTGELLPNRIVDGKILPAQIFIPSYLVDDINKYTSIDENGVKRINSELISPELLNAFGFRIPNSGYNLMSSFEVVGFLPSYMADTIVATRDVVAQMGMDYDADKLYIYNYEHELVDGKLTRIDNTANEILDIDIQTLSREDLYKYIIEPISSDNIKKYLKRAPFKYNYIYDEYYNTRYSESVDASTLIGSFATTVTFISQLAGNDIYFTTEGEIDNIEFSDLKGNKLSDLYTTNGRLKSQVVSQFLSMALDNDKEPMSGALNINQNTVGFVNAMILSGFEEDVILKILNHPVVKDFNTNYNILIEDSGEELIIDHTLEAINRTLNGNFSEDVKTISLSDISLKNEENGLIDSNYINANKEVRESVLDFFIKVKERGKTIGNVKQLINTDSNFLSKSIFDNYIKEENINKINSIPIANASMLLGDFMEDVLVNPTTIPGFSTYYGLIYNNDLWAKHFPYSSKFIQQSLKAFTESTQTKLNENNKLKILKGIKSYLHSYSSNILNENLTKNQKLEKLIKELPVKLNEAKKKLNNKFLNLVYVEYKEGIPLISYNNSAQAGLDESYIYSDFNKLLLEDDTELGEMLIDYVMLTQPIETPRSINKFVPLEYLEVSGMTERMHDVVDALNTNNSATFNIGMALQIIRHNPTLAQRAVPTTLSDIIKNDNGDIVSFSPQESDYLKDGNILFKSFYDKDKNKWMLYQYEEESNLYKAIPLLGLDGFTEYNSQVKALYPSLVKKNNIESYSKGGVSKKVIAEKKIKVEVKDSFKHYAKYGGKSLNESLDAIKKNFPIHSTLIELIKAANPSVKFLVNNKMNARFAYSEGVISINLEELNNATEGEFVNEYLEEILHSITAPITKTSYVNLDKSNKKFIDGLNGLRLNIKDKFLNDSQYSEKYKEFLKKVDSNGYLKPNVILTQLEFDLFYPTINNQEFTAGIFVKSKFKDYLNDKQFNKDKSLIDRFLDLIKDLLSSFKSDYNVKDNSILEDSLKVTLSLIKNKDISNTSLTVKKEVDYSDLIDTSLPEISEDEFNDFPNIDLSPKYQEYKDENGLSKYIYKLEKDLDYYKLRKNSAKSLNDKNKYEKLIVQFEQEIEKLIDSASVLDAIEYAENELDRIDVELENKKVSAEALDESIRTIQNYIAFEGLILDQELLSNPVYAKTDLVKSVKEIVNRAEDTYINRISPIMRQFVVNYANDSLNYNFKIEDVFKMSSDGKKVIFKDTGIIQSLTRSISTTGEPLDNIIQIAIDDANSKANDKTFEEFKEIDTIFNNYKSTSSFKNKGYDKFIDSNGSLIKRHNDEYSKEYYRLSNKINSSRSYKERLANVTSLMNHFKNEGVIIDINKLYKTDEEGFFKKIENTEYLNQLKEEIGFDSIDYILNIQNNKINSYNERLQAEIDAQNEDVQGWIEKNSPSKIIEALNSNKYTYGKENKIRNGYYYLYTPPNKNNINPEFDEILNNKESFDFYTFLTEKLNDYYSKAPDRQNEGLSYNFLPYIPMSLIEELNEKGVFSVMKHGQRMLFNSITEKDSPTLFEEIDPITQDKKYILKYPISNNSSFLTDEEIEVRDKNRSTDLQKILKYVAGKSIDYEYKREIESPLKIIEAIYNDSHEIGEDKDENGQLLIKKDGLGNRKAAATYAITKQLYNIDPKNQYNIKSEKKYTKEEKELKEKLEARLQEEQLRLETALPEEISSIEHSIRKYESALGRLGAHYSTDSFLKANMKYTQLLGMGYNIAGSFANLFSAGIGNGIEAAGGENFNNKDVTKAFGIMLNSSVNLIPGATIGGILGTLIAPGFGTVLGLGLGSIFNSGNFTGTGKKINSLMNRFKILGNIIDSKSYEKDFIKGDKKWYQKLSPFYIYTMSEYFSQGVTMVAILLNRQTEVTVKTTGEKKTIPLWEVFNNEGEWNELYEENEGWKDGGSDFILTKRNIEQTRDKVHGNYSTPTRIQGNVFGRMAVQYRRWMIETLANRVEGERKDFKLSPEGRNVEGRWRTYLTHDKETGTTSINVNNIKRVMKQIAFMDTKKVYNDLTDAQQANLKRNVRELQIFITLMSMYYGLKYMSDDDDESYLANAMLNSLFRISDDLEFYLNPMSFETVTSQLMPSLNTIAKTADVLNYSWRVMADDTILDPIARDVSDEALNVLGRKSMRLVPAGNVSFTVNRIVSETSE